MTIEVRQLTIRSQVGPQRAEPAADEAALLQLLDQQREQLRRELMAECREWLSRQGTQPGER